MIVKHLNPVRSHQIRGHLGGRRVANNSLELGNSCPVAIIVEETTSFARLQIFSGVGTGIGHVALDSRPDCLDMISEKTLHQNDAVAPKRVYVSLG